MRARRRGDYGGGDVKVHLVWMETSATQPYIFGTNKRRENVGASQLVWQVGEWARSAVGAHGPIESAPAELVVSTSGRVEALLRDEEAARAVISEVTRRALREAAGLDLCGVISAPFEWSEPGEMAAASAAARRQINFVRSSRPGPGLRFLRLPIVAECRTSGLPASGEWTDGAGDSAETLPRSQPSLAKLVAAGSAGFRRLAHQSSTTARAMRLAVEYLENDADWVAVVHADGNGLGDLLRNLASRYTSQPNRAYADALRSFSRALDRCTEQAFREALATVPDRHAGGTAFKPVLPLVLGGDDLTAVCDGGSAIELTRQFLSSFERLTGAEPALNAYAGEAQRLTAAAGVSLVRRHFPFSAAYDLAEELSIEAKQAKERLLSSATGAPVPMSALAFHVLYDSTATSWGTIRGRLTVEDAIASGQPYVVTTGDRADHLAPESAEWLERHDLGRLLDHELALKETAPDADGRERRVLPTRPMHDLRSALHLGRLAADNQFRDLLARPWGATLRRLGVADAGGSPSLYYDEPTDDLGSDSVRWRTSLLDAMQLAGLG